MTAASEGTKIPQSSSSDIKEEKLDSVEVDEVSEGTKTPQATKEDELGAASAVPVRAGSEGTKTQKERERKEEEATGSTFASRDVRFNPDPKPAKPSKYSPKTTAGASSKPSPKPSVRAASRPAESTNQARERDRDVRRRAEVAYAHAQRAERAEERRDMAEGARAYGDAIEIASQLLGSSLGGELANQVARWRVQRADYFLEEGRVATAQKELILVLDMEDINLQVGLREM